MMLFSVVVVMAFTLHCRITFPDGMNLLSEEITCTGQVITYTTMGLMVDRCRIVHMFRLSYVYRKVTFPMIYPVVV